MRKLGIGVIGCGGAAQVGHLPWYARNPHVRLVAVADVDEKKARYIAEKYHVKDYYADYEKLLQRDDVDAVSICTPVAYHCEQAVRAFEYGKHVLLEKPMARDIYECDLIIRASEKASRILMVGFMKRFNPAFEFIKSVLDRGVIGKPFNNSVSFCVFSIRSVSLRLFISASPDYGSLLLHGSLHRRSGSSRLVPHKSSSAHRRTSQSPSVNNCPA